MSRFEQNVLHFLWEFSQERACAKDEKSLIPYGRRVYSQNDEDGIIEEIFRRIGVENKIFVEIGVGDGAENNTRNLLDDGWSGLWVEASADYCQTIENNFLKKISSGALKLVNEPAKIDTIDSTIQNHITEDAIDLLSIDVDGIDYWLWKAVESFRPRVVAIEYNASWRPPLSQTVPADHSEGWDGTDYFGASLNALDSLGKHKGYSLVGCSYAGVNAFFVDTALLGEHFSSPFTPEHHYQPPRYGAIPLIGHSKRHGAIVTV